MSLNFPSIIIIFFLLNNPFSPEIILLWISMVKLITWVANIFSNCFLTGFLEAGFKISFANLMAHPYTLIAALDYVQERL